MNDKKDSISISPETKKELEIINFLKDFSTEITFEYENPSMIELIELMEFAPIKVIIKKGILKYIRDNYDNIKMLRILSEDEGIILENIKSNFEFINDYFNYQIYQFRTEQIGEKK